MTVFVEGLNLVIGREYMAEIRDCRDIQAELKRAFKDDALDGGWRAALTHPLYLQAEARITELQGLMKGLI